MEGSEVKTYNPRKGKETANGRYYKLGFSINNYDTTNDFIRFSTAQLAKGELGGLWWLITIQRDNLDLEISSFGGVKSKCEIIDKSTFDNEIVELKKEIEKNNKLIDEYYKKTNII